MSIRFHILATVCCLCLGLGLAAEKTNNETEKVETTESKSSAKPADSSDEKGETPPSPHTEVTVTATRTPTSSIHLGRAVSLIDSEQIRLQGEGTLQGVLEDLTGFSFTNGGSFGSQTSLFVRGGESNFNIVMIDGVQVNQPGGEFDFANLSTANVDRIEVVRGPSSVLYGAEAASSTINILTRAGEGRPTGHLLMEGGSFGSKLFSGSVSGSDRRLSYSLGALHSDTEGHYAFNSAWDRQDVSARVGYEINEVSGVTAAARLTVSDQHFPTDSIGAVVDPNDYRTSNSQVYSAGYYNRFSNTYGTKVSYGLYRFDSQVYTLEDGITDFYNDRFDTEVTRHFVDWQNDVHLGENHLFTGGLSFEREDSPSHALDRRSVGFFLQDQVTWSDRVFITGGVRYDNNNRFSSFTTGNLDVAFLISSGIKLRGSVGNGFRAPEFNEIIGFPSWGILGNPNLRPEKNTAAEVGADFYSPRGRARFSSTAFFNRFSDLIEFTFFGQPGSPNYVNVEKARSQGLEFEGALNPRDYLWVGFNYTLTATQVTDAGTDPTGNFVVGEALLRRPRNMGLVYAALGSPRLNARFSLRYKGERDDRQFFPDFSSQRVTLPSYLLADLSVTIPLFKVNNGSGRVSAVVRGLNIFDKRYAEIAGFEAPGRSFRAGIRLDY